MIEEFGLTLPPDMEPLNASDKETHLEWRKQTLRRVREERVRAERVRLLRRIVTLGCRGGRNTEFKQWPASPDSQYLHLPTRGTVVLMDKNSSRPNVGQQR